MDPYQQSLRHALHSSMRRLREGQFADEVLAADEIARLCLLSEHPFGHVVRAWLWAHSTRRQARQMRDRSRQARRVAESTRVRTRLHVIDFREPS